MSPLSKAITVGFLTGLLGLGFIPLGLDLEESIGLGFLFKMRGPREAPSDVIIVTMDKDSADHLNLPSDPEKWPRSLHARLIENVVKKGGAVIAYDILFQEAHSLEEDLLFAEAIRSARRVVLCECLKKDTAPLINKWGTHAGVLNIEQTVPPIPLFAQSALALAPFPLPKVPVKVSQFWTFKTGAGDTPTLPVVTFQVFTLNIYDDFLRLLGKVSPDKAEQLPRSKAPIISKRSVIKLIRA